MFGEKERSNIFRPQEPTEYSIEVISGNMIPLISPGSKGVKKNKTKIKKTIVFLFLNSDVEKSVVNVIQSPFLKAGINILLHYEVLWSTKHNIWLIHLT